MTTEAPLAGKTVIVTGGATGIGAAIVTAAADGGRERGDRLRRLLGGGGRRSSRASRRPGTARWRSRPTSSRPDDLEPGWSPPPSREFGRLDVMVNNAGIETRHALLDTTEKDYDAVLGINLKGAFFGTQAAARQFVAQGGGGVVVNISSVHEDWPMPGNAAYCVSKGGMRMLTRTAGVELGAHGIRVVGVAPGAVDTPINASTEADPAKMRALDDAIPLGHVAEPERDRRRGRVPRLRRGALRHRDDGRGRRRPHAVQPGAVTRHLDRRGPGDVSGPRRWRRRCSWSAASRP